MYKCIGTLLSNFVKDFYKNFALSGNLKLHLKQARNNYAIHKILNYIQGLTHERNPTVVLGAQLHFRADETLKIKLEPTQE